MLAVVGAPFRNGDGFAGGKKKYFPFLNQNKAKLYFKN
jgi:hypothetical protein